MKTMPGPAIERFSHLFLTLENPADSPKIKKLPFAAQRELLAFFGMESNPFANEFEAGSDNPTGIPGHEPAYQRMMQCVEDEMPLGMLTAPGGMGRGQVVERLRRNLGSRNYRVIELVAGENVGAAAFLKDLLHDLEIVDLFNGYMALEDQLAMLRQCLLTRFVEQDMRLVIIISEAQYLPLEFCYLVKWLTNFEISRRKLVSVLLVGDDVLQENPPSREIAFLANLVYLAARIPPLTPPAIHLYLQEKLRQVGLAGELFSSEACGVISKVSGGICRDIDNLAYNALVAAFRAGEKNIDPACLARFA